MLLERPGEVVTREELRQALWTGDTFVDFDHGLNNAINRLRETLGDSADSPRFIETLPRRGYRFIAPVEHLGANFGPPVQDPASRANGSEVVGPDLVSAQMRYPQNTQAPALAQACHCCRRSRCPSCRFLVAGSAEARPIHNCRAAVQEPEPRAK